MCDCVHGTDHRHLAVTAPTPPSLEQEVDGFARRRRRLEEGGPAGGGGLEEELAWLERFGQGEEEEDDGPLPGAGAPPGSQPTQTQVDDLHDADSRLVLEQLSGSGEALRASTSRAAPLPLRPPGGSFLGRRPSIQRLHSSGSGVAGTASRSFVFGRGDDSGSCPAPPPAAANSQRAEPTSFQQLGRLVQAPGAALQPATASLVARLGSRSEQASASHSRLEACVQGAVTLCVQLGQPSRVHKP